MSTDPIIETLEQIINNSFPLTFDTSFLIWSSCFIVIITYGITQIVNKYLKHSAVARISELQFKGITIVILSSFLMTILVSLGFPLGAPYADHPLSILDMLTTSPLIIFNLGLLGLGVILGFMVGLLPFYWIHKRENIEIIKETKSGSIEREPQKPGTVPIIPFIVLLILITAIIFFIADLWNTHRVTVQAFEIAFFIYLFCLFIVVSYPIARIILLAIPTKRLTEAGISEGATLIAIIGAMIGPFIAVFVLNITAFVVPFVGLTTPDISVWTYNGEFTHIIGPLILVGVLMILHRVLHWGGSKRGLNFAEIGIIYTTLSISSIFAIMPMWIIRFLVFEFFKGAGAVGGATGSFIPSVWIPSWPTAIDNMVLGGEPTWGYWVIPILFWSLYFITWGIVQFSSAVLNRQQWIEVERLNFPVAQAIVESFKAGEIEGLEEKSRVFGISPFWLGGILAFLLYIPRLLSALSVREIIPFDFSVPEFMNWLYYDNIDELGIQVAQTIFGGSANRVTLNINFAPIWIAFAFLVPIDILLGAIIWYFTFYIVLPPIQVSLGLYDNPPNQDVGTNYIFVGHRAGAVGTIWEFPIPIFGETLSIGGLFPHFISRGMWIGFPLALIWFNRRYFGQTIRKAFGRVQTSDNEDDYRFAYLGIIIGMLILVILNLMSGMGELAFVFPLFFLLIYWTWTRVRAESGFMSFFMMFGPWYHEMEALPYIYWHMTPERNFSGLPISVADTNSQQMSTSGIMFIYLSTDRALGAAPQPASMESFKLADMAGVSSRSIYPLQILAIIFGVIIVFPLVIWGTHYFGWTNFKEFSEFDFGLWEGAVGSNVTGDKITGLPPEWQGWILQFLLGIPLAFLIEWARNMFLWFPISVPAIIYGDAAMTGMGLFIPNIIAYILKVLIFRYGGTRIYEKVAFPLAAGFFIFGLSAFWLSEGIGQHAGL
ncbi:MAG: DUF6785 family protein [Promethearchaeota archaeon]